MIVKYSSAKIIVLVYKIRTLVKCSVNGFTTVCHCLPDQQFYVYLVIYMNFSTPSFAAGPFGVLIQSKARFANLPANISSRLHFFTNVLTTLVADKNQFDTV